MDFFLPLHFPVCFLFWKVLTFLPRHLTEFYCWQCFLIEYPGCCEYKVISTSNVTLLFNVYCSYFFLLSDHISYALGLLSGSDRDRGLMFVGNGPASGVSWLSMCCVCVLTPPQCPVCAPIVFTAGTEEWVSLGNRGRPELMQKMSKVGRVRVSSPGAHRDASVSSLLHFQTLRRPPPHTAAPHAPSLTPHHESSLELRF